MPGIPSRCANKLYKVSNRYSGCKGICLSTRSQGDQATKPKQMRVSMLKIGQIISAQVRDETMSFLYLKSFAKLQTPFSLTWTCKTHNQFQRDASFRHANVHPLSIKKSNRDTSWCILYWGWGGSVNFFVGR